MVVDLIGCGNAESGVFAVGTVRNGGIQLHLAHQFFDPALVGVVVEKRKQDCHAVAEIFVGNADRFVEFVPDLFGKLVEDDMLADQFHIGVGIRFYFTVAEYFGEVGRFGAAERLEHQIVADIIAVEVRLDELVDFGPHQFLHGTFVVFRFFPRGNIVQRMADFPLQIKIVAVFELDLLSE